MSHYRQYKILETMILKIIFLNLEVPAQSKLLENKF